MQIHLIRHGQANAAGLNYDKLTDQGYEQARLLGRRLQQNGVQFCTYARGSLVRHVQTLEGILDGIALAKSSETQSEKEKNSGTEPAGEDKVSTGTSGESKSPQIIEEAGLNEIDLDSWKSLAQEIAKSDAAFSSMLQHLNTIQGSGRRRRLAAVTGRVLDFWIRGQTREFLEFREAVVDSINSIASTRPGPALVVSSGTPIAILLARALGEDRPESIFHWLRHLANTSYSIIDVSSRWKALQINSLDHLPMNSRSLM